MDLRLVRLNKLGAVSQADPQDLLLVDVKQPDGSFVSNAITIFDTFQTESIRLTNLDDLRAKLEEVRIDIDLDDVETQADANAIFTEAILELQKNQEEGGGSIGSPTPPEADGLVPLANGTIWIKTTNMHMYVLNRETDTDGTEHSYWVGVTETKV